MTWKKLNVYCPNCGEQAVAMNSRVYEDNAGPACVCASCKCLYFGIAVPYAEINSYFDEDEIEYDWI